MSELVLGTASLKSIDYFFAEDISNNNNIIKRFEYIAAYKKIMIILLKLKYTLIKISLIKLSIELSQRLKETTKIYIS